MALLGSMHSRARLFGATFWIVLACGLGYTFLRSPVYQSEATIAVYRTLPANALPSEGGGGGVAIGGDVQQAEDDPAVVLMETRRLLAWPMLATLHERLREQLGKSAPQSASDLQQMLAAQTEPETNVIALSAKGDERTHLPAILEAWIGLYMAEKDSRKADESSSNREELAQQVTDIERRLADKRAQLENFRAQHDIVSLEHEDNAVTARLKGLNASLAEASKKKAELEAQVTAMRRDIAAGKSVLRREDRSEILAMEARAREMREELLQAEKGYTAAYIRLDPRLRALQENVATLERKIDDNRMRSQREALAETEQDLAGAAETVANLQHQLDENKAAAIGFAARFSEHKALVSELEQLEALLRAAKSRLVRAEMEGRSRLPRVVVVAPPTLPDTHVWPNYTRDAAIALGIALAAGLVAVWLREFLQRSGRADLPPPLVHIAMPAGGSLGALGMPTAALPGGSPLALPVSQTPPRELSPAEVGALWGAADERGKVIIAALLNGLAAPEIAALQWSQVQQDAAAIQLPGSPGRLVRASGALREALEHLRDPTASHVLGSTSQTLFDESDLSGLLTAAAHDAGVASPGEVTPDVLRHTYIAFLVRQGVRFTDLSNLVGQVPPATLSFYGPLSPPGPRRPLDDIQSEYPITR